MDTVRSLTQQADSFVKAGLNNAYVMAAIKITLTLYAAQLAPRLPSAVSDTFQNTYVKIIALILIAYISNLDLQLAIVLAIVFVLGVNYFAGRGLLESFADYSSEYEADKKYTLIEPKSIIYPGCHDIKMADLEAAFDNDALKLQTTVMHSFQELLAKTTEKDAKDRLVSIAHATGLPFNVEMNDENAPLIATVLMYNGFQFGSDCHAPK